MQNTIELRLTHYVIPQPSPRYRPLLLDPHPRIIFLMKLLHYERYCESLAMQHSSV